ncbi:alpha-hydroxy-acid oxidizing protein [Halomonas sp. MCCC 1A11036]|uniref:Alpha-hydroxy-acid oxidizing protein n=1 Tax=Billgrantia zhangzhouensis TaxID=2733481 RepID=A0ABS9AJQ0_9GAMM|nr:alpha-hydroxy acid oxidase [Halomonas zhangzhouensis]MCE8021969.1 alpha-hydroxy-acid oxidizing protein [Halomonas zhangzhouensis]
MVDSRRIHSIEGLRQAARRRLPKAIFDFFDGGAEDELTLADNRSAFGRVKLAPRCLVNVAEVGLDTDVVGGPSALPLAVAPTGAVGFGRHGGDIAIARAAAEAGVPYTLSTSATASIEQIADAAPGRLWFQAYVLKDKEMLNSLLFRAKSAGYEALMITVDLPVGGKRERDFRNHLSFPFRYTARNLLDFARRPAWAMRMLCHGVPVMENLKGLEAPSASATKLASSVGRNYDPSFDWEALERLRDQWPRKLIVKGVMRADDAVRLAAMGCDGMVVSNHGGRQLDGAAATLEMLPEVVRAVGGRVPVLVDGGVRRGADILKARALGAQGVLVGRATLWGAVADGQRGAAQALAILRDELQRSMQLCGVRDINGISRELLFERQEPDGAEYGLGDRVTVPSL